MLKQPQNPVMELKKVSLTSILDDISCDIFLGDRIGIIGASGAGKTSLLRLLNRLNTPTAGHIYLEHQELAKIPIKKIRQQIVLVPQEPKLLGMTVQETIAYPLVLQKLSSPEIKQRLNYWLDHLKVPQEWLDRNELQLSVGQKQLVTIVRGLVMQPKILLLDEPTSALDIGRAFQLVELLITLANNQQTTIIMINHQLEIVRQFAQRILYLEQGKLIENSSTDNINWQALQTQLINYQTQPNSEWE